MYENEEDIYEKFDYSNFDFSLFKQINESDNESANSKNLLT